MSASTPAAYKFGGRSKPLQVGTGNGAVEPVHHVSSQTMNLSNLIPVATPKNANASAAHVAIADLYRAPTATDPCKVYIRTA